MVRIPSLSSCLSLWLPMCPTETVHSKVITSIVRLDCRALRARTRFEGGKIPLSLVAVLAREASPMVISWTT
jgi:hypothetical protein